jgi:hypothetical protein
MLGLAVAAGLTLPAAATAQDDGVTVDPDSPAGKEYAIPFDRARDEAGGGASRDSGDGSRDSGDGSRDSGDGSRSPGAATGGGDGRGGDGGAELFGAGVRRAGQDEDEQGGGGAVAQDAGVPAQGAATASSDGGASPELVLTGLALAVLAVGGVVALTLRRLSRSR